tara:strand:+ start:2109 stop:2984 length:876 start_codon:yes stop_codon:yes gene_type:complete
MKISVLKKEQKEFYRSYFYSLGFTQGLLLDTAFEFNIDISSLLPIRVDDIKSYIRFDCFIHAEHSSRNKTKKIALNNFTRSLLTRILNNAKDLEYAFSKSTSNSNRAIKSQPPSRQTAYRWLNDCHKSHFKINMLNHDNFNFQALPLITSSEEGYYHLMRDLSLVLSGDTLLLLNKDIDKKKADLFGDRKSAFIDEVRRSLRLAEVCVNKSSVIPQLGYNGEEFNSHIESFFDGDIGWHNRSSWHIDHIKPVVRFIDTEDLSVMSVNSLNNIQVLSKTINLNKKAKTNETI